MSPHSKISMIFHYWIEYRKRYLLFSFIFYTCIFYALCLCVCVCVRCTSFHTNFISVCISYAIIVSRKLIYVFILVELTLFYYTIFFSIGNVETFWNTNAIPCKIQYKILKFSSSGFSFASRSNLCMSFLNEKKKQRKICWKKENENWRRKRKIKNDKDSITTEYVLNVNEYLGIKWKRRKRVIQIRLPIHTIRISL